LPYISLSATAPSEAASQSNIVTLPVADNKKMTEPIKLPAHDDRGED
jgi:hypothetical protein